MIGVIIASRKVGINPDNVATPIAASLGDLITLSLLAGISTGLYKELGNSRPTHRETHTRTTVLFISLGPCINSRSFVLPKENFIPNANSLKQGFQTPGLGTTSTAQTSHIWAVTRC